MTLPAEEPGTPLEPPGNRWPREMVTLDRIRKEVWGGGGGGGGGGGPDLGGGGGKKGG